LLTQDIEDSFSAKKAGAVFVDLTAVYDTVWHRGLTCKLLRLLPDKHMVRMIMEMVGNRSFTHRVDITRCTLEAACWLWPGCVSNNVTNSHLSLGPFNNRVLRSCLVPQCSHLPH